MTNIISLKSCSADDFYEALRSVNGIAPIHAKIHQMLCDMQPDMTLDAKKVLFIYFSLLEDGNTRLALDVEKAFDKWCVKWDSLMRIAMDEKLGLTFEHEIAKSDCKTILSKGIYDILNNNYGNIIETRSSNTKIDTKSVRCPLIRSIDDRDMMEYLYATRYFDAKCIIEEKSKELFKFEKNEITDEARMNCQESFKKYLKDTDFRLARCQLDAIIRGTVENLIITGGPGTGKTTVICFLLWKLLTENEELLKWDIKLAAPSGKAADRMRESILNSLSKFKRETNPKVYHALREMESFTLHRLLSYSPRKNQFHYNAENKFPENRIFIIDEASMIDIDLFARFMRALPQNNCRVFILGDPDQLPSVEAGAVLGEMLEATDIAVMLDESMRFSADSNIGRLSLAIQAFPRDRSWPAGEKPEFHLYEKVDFKDIRDRADEKITHCAINYLSLYEDKDKAKKQLENLILEWVDAFYLQDDYIKACERFKVSASGDLIDFETGRLCTTEQLNWLWNITQNARVLSAERKGLTGVLTLNELVRKSLKISDFEQFYVGQMLMLTKNQSLLRLYNGDCGIVLGGVDSWRLYLLVKKVRTQQNDNNEDVVDYMTYPLSLLPRDALESAFAMTIHKSQGSGYKNIMMFLPNTEGHPLLNNQMIYTGVTRTERISLTIVANEAAFEYGCRTRIVRDTGIHISK